jgi:Flp pilus assembly protein protease CpaA
MEMITLLLTKMGLTGVLVTAAVWDLRTRRVPHILSWGLLLVATGLRTVHPEGLFWTSRMGEAACLFREGGWALSLLLSGMVLVEGVAHAWRLPMIGLLVTGIQLSGFLWGADPTIGFTAGWWVVAYGLWAVHVLGGADARLFMAMVALFPRPALVAALSGGLLLVSLTWLVLVRRDGALASLLEAKGRMLRGRFPSRQELEESGRPTTPGLALGGLIYMWLMS